MGGMTQKLVFLDIDGTLSGPNEQVPRSAVNACQTARRNGHLLYISTGRARVQIPERIVALGFDGIISSGGGRIEAQGTTLVKTFLNTAVLRSLIDYLSAHQKGFVLELDDGLIAGPNLIPFFHNLVLRVKGSPQESVIANAVAFFTGKLVQNESNLYRDNVHKVVFTENGDVSFDDVVRAFSADCEIFRGSIPFFGESGGEISPRGVHKGAALERVAAHHGIPLSDTIAFGDSDNDRTMLIAAGIGIAMGNAEASLKAHADYVTDRLDNDGIAKAFARYHLC
jgi:Cof subfamily protein (haloacid dehalogenase superfamily)